MRAFVFAVLVCQAISQLQLVVQYCPDAFSSAGAIVNVDPKSGQWSIDHEFKWPGDVFGCADIDEPTVSYDGSSVYFDFLSTLNVFAELNLDKGTIRHFKNQDMFFTGYENFAISGKNEAVGLSGTVEESGWCDDGCFAWGSMNTLTGAYKKHQDLPYKAISDDTYLLANDTFWVQGSYPLTPQAYCSKDETDQCLIALDTTTGAVKSTKKTTWEAYHYGHANSGTTINKVWMNGFADKCKHPYNDFLFASVDMATAEATPGACIPKNVTVHMDEWISAFSPDDSAFATASGSTEAPAQLLIFDTNSGGATVDSNLPGLAEKLKTYSGLYQIWGVSWR